MCLITKNTLRTADKDIKVMKIFSIRNGTLTNFCQGQQVNSRELIPDSDQEPKICEDKLIYEGGFIHAYSENNWMQRESSISTIFENLKLIFLDCIIPKGTLYTLEGCHLVARKMIITDPKFDNYVFN